MNEKKKITYIVLIIIILVLIAINIIIFMNNYYKDENIALTNETTGETLNENVEINTNYSTVSEEVDEENRKDKIATLSEKLRMETYFGQYISLVESKDYEGAYNLLYDGFKQTYFPTIEEFTAYCKNNYPNNIVVEYTDIDREGTIFILKVKLRNPITDSTQTEVSEQQIVIIENDINDFKLSFAVAE